MRINRLEIKDFGKFTGDKVIEGIDPRVVLIFGRNEAGKTTIFNLIKSMLYGFFPAQSQTHPYSSWTNGRIEFTAFLKTNDDHDITVYRKLLSRPQGSYMIGEKAYEVKNNPLPISKHVSGEIYDKIYSLRAEDLVEIQGKAWDEVEDKLLAGYSTASIRRTRDVLKDLKAEYEKIWRESGRGKYQVKELENEIRELKKIRKEAYISEEEIRKSHKRINEIDNIVKELKDNKLSLKSLLNKSKKLAPIQKSINQIDMLKGRLIEEKLSTSLPINIKDKLSLLKESLRDIKEEMTKKKESLIEKNDEKYMLNSIDKLILDNRIEINTLSQNYGRTENLRENIHKLRYEIGKLKDRLYHESENLLTGKLDSDIRSRFEEINKSELNILVGNYRNTAMELKETSLKRDLKNSNLVKIKFPKLYIYASILSAMIVVGGFIVDNDILKIAGVGISIYGLTGILNYVSMKKSLNNDIEKDGLNELEAKILELQYSLKKDKEKLMSYLSGIPISSLIIERMDEMFVPDILKIKDMVYDLCELEKELSNYEREYSEKQEALDAFLSQFSLEAYVKEDKKIFLLKERLEDLEKSIILNENLDKEIVLIEKEHKALKEKEGEIDSLLKGYLSRLEKIGNGDIEKGLDIAEENNRIRAKINGIMEELNEITEIDSLIREIKKYEAEEAWIFSEYEVLKAEEDFEEINQKYKELEVEKARLEERIDKLSENHRLDEIESRIELLEDDLQIAFRKRDRLVLLSEIIKFADQKFKEENQPDVLRSAGKYFSIITNGKYTDIYLDDDEANTIMVKEAGEKMPKKVVDTFSKGTLNQLYLSLRLSLIDYLDKDKESLPICFDEMLINWDEERLDSSLKLLEKLSENRQIFIFTCHDWMAKKIEKLFNIKRIVLD